MYSAGEDLGFVIYESYGSYRVQITDRLHVFPVQDANFSKLYLGYIKQLKADHDAGVSATSASATQPTSPVSSANPPSQPAAAEPEKIFISTDFRKGEKFCAGGKVYTMPGENICSVRGPPADWVNSNVGIYNALQAAGSYAMVALKAYLLRQPVPKPTGITPEVEAEVKGINAMEWKDDAHRNAGTSLQVRQLLLYRMLTNAVPGNECNETVHSLAKILFLDKYKTWLKCKDADKLPQDIKDIIESLKFPAIFESKADVCDRLATYIEHRKDTKADELTMESMAKMLSRLTKLFWCCGMSYEESAEVPGNQKQYTQLNKDFHTIKLDGANYTFYPMNFFACSSVRVFFTSKMETTFPQLPGKKEKGKHCKATTVSVALTCMATAYHRLVQGMSRKVDLLQRNRKADTKQEVPHCAQVLMAFIIYITTGSRPSEAIFYDAVNSFCFLVRLPKTGTILKVPFTYTVTKLGHIFQPALASGNVPYLARQPHNKTRIEPWYDTRVAYTWPVSMLNVAYVQVLVFKVMMLFYG